MIKKLKVNFKSQKQIEKQYNTKQKLWELQNHTSS